MGFLFRGVCAGERPLSKGEMPSSRSSWVRTWLRIFVVLRMQVFDVAEVGFAGCLV